METTENEEIREDQLEEILEIDIIERDQTHMRMIEDERDMILMNLEINDDTETTLEIDTVEIEAGIESTDEEDTETLDHN